MRDIKEIEERYRNRKPKGTVIIKKWYLIIPILLIALITNPNEKDHRKAVTAKIIAATTTTVPGVNSYNYEIEDRNVNQIVESSISSTNFIFFSITKITWDSKTYSIGFGIFGNVFLSNRIDEYLRRFN